MKKKILFAVITACVCLFVFGIINVCAATYGDLTYKISYGKAAITGCNESATIIEIPSEIEGYPVTTIDDSAFQSCINLKCIVIPPNVNYIGSSAFAGCRNLQAVQITGNRMTIETLPFANCHNLTIYCYPNSVIHNYAIENNISYELINTDSRVSKIILSESNIIMKVDESEKLTATVIPDFATNKDIIWSSSNENVATVKGGVITAIGKGTATITASTSDNTVSATCLVLVDVSLDIKAPNGEMGDTISVTISSPAIPNVLGGECRLYYDDTKLEYIGTKSNLSERFLVMSAEGEGYITFLFAPSIEFSQDEQWETLPETGAVVAELQFRLTTPGEASIYPDNSWNSISIGTGPDNNTVYKLSPPNEQTIVISEVSVKELSLDKSSVVLNIGNTEVLTATVLPDDAANKNITWSSSDENVATVENGVVTAVSPGQAIIIAITEDGSKIATCIVTVK